MHPYQLLEEFDTNREIASFCALLHASVAASLHTGVDTPLTRGRGTPLVQSLRVLVLWVLGFLRALGTS